MFTNSTIFPFFINHWRLSVKSHHNTCDQVLLWLLTHKGGSFITETQIIKLRNRNCNRSLNEIWAAKKGLKRNLDIYTSIKWIKELGKVALVIAHKHPSLKECLGQTESGTRLVRIRVSRGKSIDRWNEGENVLIDNNSGFWIDLKYFKT